MRPGCCQPRGVHIYCAPQSQSQSQSRFHHDDNDAEINRIGPENSSAYPYPHVACTWLEDLRTACSFDPSLDLQKCPAGSPHQTAEPTSAVTTREPGPTATPTTRLHSHPPINTKGPCVWPGSPSLEIARLHRRHRPAYTGVTRATRRQEGGLDLDAAVESVALAHLLEQQPLRPVAAHDEVDVGAALADRRDDLREEECVGVM